MEKLTFEQWYEMLNIHKVYEKYTLKDILKLTWSAGIREADETDAFANVAVLESDEDLVLSYELNDPDFSKNHPELGLDDYELPKLSDILTPKEIEERSKRIEEKKKKYGL